MAKKRRGKLVRKNKALAKAKAEDEENSNVPHTICFGRPGIGSNLRYLVTDLRRVLQPHTSMNIQCRRSNKLRDFIDIAAPYNVSHIVYVSHSNNAAVAPAINKRWDDSVPDERDTSAQLMDPKSVGLPMLHIVRSPHGPSFTFRIASYSLHNDIQTITRRVFSPRQYNEPPLLVMQGFSDAPPHAKLVCSTFQNMFPALNVTQLKLHSMRRVLLISRSTLNQHDNEENAEENENENEKNKKKGGKEKIKTKQDGKTDNDADNDVYFVRHYAIRLENRAVSRALRKVGVGAASVPTRHVPDLSKYASIEQFTDRKRRNSSAGGRGGGGGGGDGYESSSSAMSDVDDPEPEAVDVCGGGGGGEGGVGGSDYFRQLPTGSGRISIRLIEQGPRMTLELLKVEEGVNSGTVIYHRHRKCSEQEVLEMAQRQMDKVKEKRRRRKEQERRVREKEVAKQEHKKRCAEGAQKKQRDVMRESGDAFGGDEADEQEQDGEEQREDKLVEEQQVDETPRRSRKRKASTSNSHTGGTDKKFQKKKKLHPANSKN